MTNAIYTNERGRDVREGEAFEAWQIRRLSRDEFHALPWDTRLKWLAGFGVLAPTTHNTVPERFQLHPNEAAMSLWLDRKLVLSASDAVGRQATVSMGCVLENVHQAARSVGMRTSIEVAALTQASVRPRTDSDSQFTLIARMQFAEDASPENEDSTAAMLGRRMVRAQYDELVALDVALEREITDAVGELAPAVELRIIRDPATRFLFGKFQELADTTVLNRDDFASELGDWFEENDSIAPRGMRGSEFGLSDAAAQRFRRGLRREIQLLPDEIGAMAKASNLGFRTATAVGVLTVETDAPCSWLAAGRAYERLALLLHRADFVNAMQAGITEVEGPNLALRGRLRTTRRPTVVFRIGKPLVPEHAERWHAARPPLESLLLA